MTLFDGRRLDPDVFAIFPRMARGRYTDQYFINAARILSRLAEEGYRFAGSSPAVEAAGLDPARVDVGNVVFSCGCPLAANQVRIYYGAADTAICVATANVEELIDWLEKHGSGGRRDCP